MAHWVPKGWHRGSERIALGATLFDPQSTMIWSDTFYLGANKDNIIVSYFYSQILNGFISNLCCFMLFCCKLDNDVSYAFFVLIFWGYIIIGAIPIAICISVHMFCHVVLWMSELACG